MPLSLSSGSFCSSKFLQALSYRRTGFHLGRVVVVQHCLYLAESNLGFSTGSLCSSHISHTTFSDTSFITNTSDICPPTTLFIVSILIGGEVEKGLILRPSQTLAIFFAALSYSSWNSVNGVLFQVFLRYKHLVGWSFTKITVGGRHTLSKSTSITVVLLRNQPVFCNVPLETTVSLFKLL